jgi:peptidoglycan/xylan/chitin deacetylase (PgdA/CDA1 family)
MKAVTIGFHDVVEDGGKPSPIAAGHSTRYTITRTRLRSHLDVIRSCAGAEGASTVNGISANGISRIPILISIDDGAQSGYSIVAEELENHGWRGHFFITTDWIGSAGFMNAAQIRALHARGHIVGSHSCSHPSRMSALSTSALVREWGRSCATLSDIVGQRVTTASVPGGYYEMFVGDAAAECGITNLFTSEPRTNVYTQDKCAIFGRYAVDRTTQAAKIARMVAGDFWWRANQRTMWEVKKIAKRVGGQLYLTLRHILLQQLGKD